MKIIIDQITENIKRQMDNFFEILRKKYYRNRKILFRDAFRQFLCGSLSIL